MEIIDLIFKVQEYYLNTPKYVLFKMLIPVIQVTKISVIVNYKIQR